MTNAPQWMVPLWKYNLPSMAKSKHRDARADRAKAKRRRSRK